MLNPVPQAVELVDLRRADLRERQGGGQIPRRRRFERGGVEGGGYQAHALVRARARAQRQLRAIADELLAMTVKASRPLPGSVGQAGGGFCGGEGGRLLRIRHLLPGAMRRTQSHDVGNVGCIEAGFERESLAVDGVGHHQTKRDARRTRLLNELPGQGRLGRKGGILASFGQAAGGSIGFDAQRHLATAVGPLAGHRHHPIGDMPQLAQILLGRQHHAAPALGIAGLVDDEDPAGMGPQHGMRLPQLQPALVERRGIPGRLHQEVVQRLPVGTGHQRCQLHQGLVVLARQEQAYQVLPQRAPFLIAGEQVVKVATELVNRRGGRRRGFARSRHGSASRGSRTLRRTTVLQLLLRTLCQT